MTIGHTEAEKDNSTRKPLHKYLEKLLDAGWDIGARVQTDDLVAKIREKSFSKAVP